MPDYARNAVANLWALQEKLEELAEGNSQLYSVSDSLAVAIEAVEGTIHRLKNESVNMEKRLRNELDRQEGSGSN